MWWAFEPRRDGGAPQRYCGQSCRRDAQREHRQKPKAGPDDDPEPLAILLSVPMPRCRYRGAAACAGPRQDGARPHKGSVIATQAPINDDHRGARAQARPCG